MLIGRVHDLKARRLTGPDYGDNAVAMAKALLGAWLCRRLDDGTVLRARIVETEAYMAVEDLRGKGVSPVYLLTDHIGFYERYGWEFHCLAMGDGATEASRLYMHR